MGPFAAARMDTILHYGDPRLRRVCRAAAPGETGVCSVADRLWAVLRQRSGWGLAAPQLGIPLRICVVIDRRPKGTGLGHVLVNPELSARSPEMVTHQEGCLSFPDLYLELARPHAVQVRYLDLDGTQQRLNAEGLFARAILHELDHLDGILFMDHLSRWRRWLLSWRLRRLATSSREPGA